MVLGGMKAVGLGMVAGAAGALALGSTLSGLLVEVDPRDPMVFGVVVATLASVGLLASFVPARRVSKLDAVVALDPEAR